MKNITRWEPLKELADMGSVFDRFMGRDFLWGNGERAWSPAIEVTEKKDKLSVKAQVPGMDKNDIKVNVEGDMLILKGETKKEEEKKEEGYYYNEMSYGSFYRAIQLPVEVNPDKVKAVYKNGVLTIDLPKSELAKPKEIEVKIE